MAWTNPRTWNVGELVTKAIMDAHVRDNLSYLKTAVDTLEIKSYPVILNTDTALVAGNGLIYVPIPASLDGYNLTGAKVFRKSGSGTLSLQVHNDSDNNDMLSVNAQPGTPGTVNTAYDDVVEDNILRIDIDSAGTSSLYCSLVLKFGLP